MTGNAAKIEIVDLSVSFEERDGMVAALRNVTFSVREGEFVSVIGSSGCGKSTLLSVLEGLRNPSGGAVFIDGRPVTGAGPDRGVVFQQYSLFPWMTARNNVAFGIRHARRDLSRESRLKLADEYLGKVGLAGAERRYPSRLSGGMQQRVAIARALAMDTDILLMDEPFGAVDAKNRALLQELLLELWSGEEKKKTVVFITHDLDEAIFLSDRVIMLTDSPGRLHLDVRVPFPRPRDRYGLLGSVAYLDFRRKLSVEFFHIKSGESKNAWVII